MEISDATKLIEGGPAKLNRSQVWADLGSGTGVFTLALCQLLNAGSTVYAIDRDDSALQKLSAASDDVIVIKQTRNFLSGALNLPPLDGLLMGNSLHFVKEKDVFVARIKEMIKPSGRLVIIEYEGVGANQWVPYPVDFDALKSLMERAGFQSVHRLAKRPSLFNQGQIYSCVIY